MIESKIDRDGDKKWANAIEMKATGPGGRKLMHVRRMSGKAGNIKRKVENIAKDAIDALHHLRMIQKLNPNHSCGPSISKCQPPTVNEPIGWRTYIFYLLDNPQYSFYSRMVSFIIMALIFLSCISFTIQSLPKYRYPNYGEKEHDSPPIFATIELACVSIFTVEYVTRLLTVEYIPDEVFKSLSYHAPTFSCGRCGGPYKCKWLGWARHPMNVIDLLSIVPFFIIDITNANNGGGVGLSFLRILRLSRGFRIFKLGKYAEGLYLFSKVIRRSLSALYLLVFFGIISIMIFGSTMYYSERGHYDENLGYYVRKDLYGDGLEQSPFTSIPRSFWWVIVTSTTVGYGDMVPRTILGRLVGTITMYFGILVLAMPLAIISSNFQQVHQEHRKHNRNFINASSKMTAKLMELLLTLERINSEIMKAFVETEVLCRQYLALTSNIVEAFSDSQLDLDSDEEDRKDAQPVTNASKLVLDEFRSLQEQLECLIALKRSVAMRIKRLGKIIVREREHGREIDRDRGL